MEKGTECGPPEHIRSDNGPEFAAKAVRRRRPVAVRAVRADLVVRVDPEPGNAHSRWLGPKCTRVHPSRANPDGRIARWPVLPGTKSQRPIQRPGPKRIRASKPAFLRFTGRWNESRHSAEDPSLRPSLAVPFDNWAPKRGNYRVTKDGLDISSSARDQGQECAVHLHHRQRVTLAVAQQSIPQVCLLAPLK